MRRRDLISLLGGAAAWPVVARAQADRVRRIGVLMAYDENDPVWKARISAFTQALADLGWADGRNVRMDLRGYGDDVKGIPVLAHEMVGLQPDIIVVAGSTPATAALQGETRTIPIVSVTVVDPVASGRVRVKSRPPQDDPHVGFHQIRTLRPSGRRRQWARWGIHGPS
jgi:putative ABC transport system substrate-binding protein